MYLQVIQPTQEVWDVFNTPAPMHLLLGRWKKPPLSCLLSVKVSKHICTSFDLIPLRGKFWVRVFFLSVFILEEGGGIEGSGDREHQTVSALLMQSLLQGSVSPTVRARPEPIRRVVCSIDWVPQVPLCPFPFNMGAFVTPGSNRIQWKSCCIFQHCTWRPQNSMSCLLLTLVLGALSLHVRSLPILRPSCHKKSSHTGRFLHRRSVGPVFVLPDIIFCVVGTKPSDACSPPLSQTSFASDIKDRDKFCLLYPFCVPQCNKMVDVLCHSGMVNIIQQ